MLDVVVSLTCCTTTDLQLRFTIRQTTLLELSIAASTASEGIQAVTANPVKMLIRVCGVAHCRLLLASSLQLQQHGTMLLKRMQ
jgi:hypothetical protein